MSPVERFVTRNWRALGTPAPDALTDARLQLHWAAQLVASVGNTFIELQPDDSQSNMGWHIKRGSLVGNPIPRAKPLTTALNIEWLTIELAGPGDTIFAEYPLSGNTLDQGYSWLHDQIAAATNGELTQPLARPTYELPSHPTESGAAFSLDRDGSSELARWYANADLMLRALVADKPDASPVRCWPHHFDIGTLIVLDPERDAESARSIGVGMSPGDDTYTEPYYYVNPYPNPPGKDLPPLPVGAHWHTEGWIGAILTGSALVEAGAAEAQAARAQDYLHAAVDACSQILGSGHT